MAREDLTDTDGHRIGDVEVRTPSWRTSAAQGLRRYVVELGFARGEVLPVMPGAVYCLGENTTVERQVA